MAILIPTFILVAILVFTSGGRVLENLKTSFGDGIRVGFVKVPPKEGKTPPQPAPSPKTILQPAPPIVLDTTITKGPLEGETFLETGTVTFEFSGEAIPQVEEKMVFETKVESFDQDWQLAKENSRTLTLPGPNEYTFYVRAKVGNAVDENPARRTFRINVSPYYGKVKISGMSPPKGSGNATITLSTNIQKGDKVITITKWQIETTQKRYYIPQGVPLYPGNTGTAKKEDIALQSGDVVTISTGLNPVANNVNFRVNKCFGNLGNLPFSAPKFICPLSKPTLEQISSFSPACQDFILKNVGACSIADFSKNSNVLTDFGCYSYLLDLKKTIEKVSAYEYCVQTHAQDPDFSKNHWYIYTEGEQISREGHDRVTLRDENGLFIDKKIY